MQFEKDFGKKETDDDDVPRLQTGEMPQEGAGFISTHLPKALRPPASPHLSLPSASLRDNGKENASY